MAANISLSTQVISQPISIIASVPAQRSFSDPSQDIGLSILAFVPTLDLVATSCVNRSWRDLTNDNYFLEARLSQDERDNLTPLINEGHLSLKEACIYSHLSHFVSNVVVSGMREFIRRQKNPTLQPRINHRGITMEPYTIMPEPYAQYGNYSFAIRNLKDIEIQEAGAPTITILSGMEGILLTHLAVDGDFLFALQEDKKIVQWNYKTKEKVKEITHTNFERIAFERVAFDKFYVKNGLIITNHCSVHEGKVTPYLEIIPYEDPDPKKRQLITLNFRNGIPFLMNLILKDNQIIYIGYNSNAIHIINLSNSETETYELDSIIKNIYLDRHMLYVADDNGLVRKFNIKSKKLIPIMDLRIYSLSTHIVVNNVAFTCNTFSTFSSLSVEDFRSGIRVRSLEHLSANINNVTACKTDFLKKIIKKIKEKPSAPQLIDKLESIIDRLLNGLLGRLLEKLLDILIKLTSLIDRFESILSSFISTPNPFYTPRYLNRIFAIISISYIVFCVLTKMRCAFNSTITLLITMAKAANKGVSKPAAAIPNPMQL